MTSALEVAGLTLQSGAGVILDRVELRVPCGTTAAIVGRGGVGKSGLLGILVGHIIAKHGEVRVLDRRIPDHVGAIRRQTTWVDRSGVLEPHLNVRQNVHLVLRLSQHAVPGRAEVDKALRESDLPDRVFDRSAAFLGAHETLAVWIAVARLRQTPLVLLDDPTALLSPSESGRIGVLIRELCATGATVLLSTRDRRFADDVAHAVHVLEGGRLSNGRSTADSEFRGVNEFVAALV